MKLKGYWKALMITGRPKNWESDTRQEFPIKKKSENFMEYF